MLEWWLHVRPYFVFWEWKDIDSGICSICQLSHYAIDLLYHDNIPCWC